MSRALVVLRESASWLRRTAMLACGIPDYDGYLAHMRASHPDEPPLPYGEFFRQRQAVRYGRDGRAPCC